ncbi:membrane protein [Lysobacter defluvii IMMIB APB-9 = DSM 18482]|uniref:Membrane protein n=1 Tax=Lysobacter defluvii IMMIB APB-9 = DSM 18482 TaxID=1385515 RepID=A0A0A0MAJ4_9GAMM|nr:membrane protein [Lysobacter defluvii IMMIB APB-9 = DSM 18482]
MGFSDRGSTSANRSAWYMSLLGSGMTLSYFIFSHNQDSVVVIQNLFPAFTAAYSLQLDIRHRRRVENRVPE